MKKLIFILFFTISAFIVNAQRYDNGIILQSLTDVLTKNQPVGTHITLLDSAEFYILNTSQVVGTSLATMIAAGEAVEFFNTTDVSTETIYTAAEVNAKIDSLATALGSSSGSGIIGADSTVFNISTHKLIVWYDRKQYIYTPADSVIYGENLIVNGTFDDTSNWTLSSSSITGGVLSMNATGYSGEAYQDVSGMTNGTYRIEFEVTSYTSGSLYGLIGYYGTSTNFPSLISAEGVYAFNLTLSGSSTFYLIFMSDNGFEGTIDNVSVKEVL